MSTKRLWIALLTIPVCLISVLVIGAQRSQPANAGGVIDPTCVSSLPCIEYDNNGTGPGIRGVSLTGNGSNGITRVNSTSAATGREGVFGNDMSTSGSFNSGVRGLSARGTGVLGNSTSGPGISGNSSSGIGVQATSSNNIGALVVGGLVNAGAGDNFPALSVIGSVAGGDFSDLIDACRPMTSSSLCFNNNALFRVDSLGDVATTGQILASTNGIFERAVSVGVASVPAPGDINIAGQYLKASSCVAGCVAATTTSAGRAVASYAAQETAPTIEDFGEAQMVNGQAHVALGADFANVIDGRANYLVFITPEGDNRGVYVSSKTPTGFAVHEGQGGRSSFTFSYRVIAKPFGLARPRLPMVAEPVRSPHMGARLWHPGNVVPVH
jgi:hypothetical protein